MVVPQLIEMVIFRPVPSHQRRNDREIDRFSEISGFLENKVFSHFQHFFCNLAVDDHFLGVHH